MMLLSVLYPSGADARFDQTYYLQKHIPLLKSRWQGMGLNAVQVLRGASAAGGGTAPYQVVTLLSFASHQDFQNCVAKHGKEIFADVANFTNVQPVVQLNDPVG